MQDQDLIKSVLNNNSDKALNSLYKHFPMMKKMILQRGGNVQDAEDVFQEALIIFIGKIKQDDFALTAKASTYLFSVCRFLWNDELKKRKQPVPFDLEIASEEQQELERLIEQDSRSKLAEKALEAIRDRCRELLLLFYEDRLKLKDIAAQMGYSSESTAKNQKYKCLEGARNKLKELKQSSPTF
jgi:RNA polymerase sigma factor (sigma-70 family)